MRMQEQGLGAAVVKVVGVLLLVSLGCTRTLERPASHAQASAQAAPVEQVATSAEAAPVAAETAPIEVPAEPQLRVHEIRLVERDARTALVVRFSRPIEGVTHFALSAPNRVVVDVGGPIGSVVTNRTYSVSGHGVARVRVERLAHVAAGGRRPHEREVGVEVLRDGARDAILEAGFIAQRVRRVVRIGADAQHGDAGARERGARERAEHRGAGTQPKEARTHGASRPSPSSA